MKNAEWPDQVARSQRRAAFPDYRSLREAGNAFFGGSWAVEGWKRKRAGRRAVGIEFEGAVAAVLEKLNAGQGGGRGDAEGAPVAGLAQGGAEALDGATRKRMGGMPARRRLFQRMRLECKWPMVVCSICGSFARTLCSCQRKGRRSVVAEEQEALAGLHSVEKRGESRPDVRRAGVSHSGRSADRVSGWKTAGRRAKRPKPMQDVAADFQAPEGLQSHLLPGATPTGEAHAAVAANKEILAQFVVAEVGAEFDAESLAELCRGTPVRSRRRHHHLRPR